MKEKIYKLALILMATLSLGSGAIVQNEIRKMLEAFSETSYAQVQEIDEEDQESEEVGKEHIMASKKESC